MARASLARILISSTAHQPLAESRSFAHFISRPAKRGVCPGTVWRTYAPTDDACGKLANCTSLTLLRGGRRPPSCVSFGLTLLLFLVGLLSNRYVDHKTYDITKLKPNPRYILYLFLVFFISYLFVSYLVSSFSVTRDKVD